MADGGNGCSCATACAFAGERPPFSAETFLRDVERVRTTGVHLPEIGAKHVAKVWAGPPLPELDPFAPFRGVVGNIFVYDGPPTVDIYVPTGRHESATGSCSFENDRLCDLWRVRVHLATMRVTDIDKYKDATDTRGLVQPAVSEDGRFIAYVMRDWTIGEEFAREASIRVRDLATDADWTPIWGDGTPTAPMPQFPAWDTGSLPGLWHHTQDKDEAGTLYLTYGKWLGHASNYTGAMVGKGSGKGEDESWKDVSISKDGVDSSGSPVLRYVSFGGKVAGNGWEQLPRVHNASGAVLEKFAAGGLAPSIQCHHPAWSPSAGEVACAGKEVPVQVDGMAYLSIYSFERALDGVGWTTSGWAFDPPSRTELTTMLGAAALAGVSRVVLTYPVFIATDEFILFTIQAQNDSGYAFSRVFLVDRTATTDRFLDLTAAIEDHIGVARAEYRSIYGCGVAV